jgi:hypothetical protein
MHLSLLGGVWCDGVAGCSLAESKEGGIDKSLLLTYVCSKRQKAVRAAFSAGVGKRQKGCILTGLGFSIWRESRVALATDISVQIRLNACQLNPEFKS